MDTLRIKIAKLVYLIAGCGIPDELDSEWEKCGENWQQNCLEIANQILSLLEPVELEALEEEEIDNAIRDYYDPADFSILYPDRTPFEEVSQATIQKNQAKYGKLFRVREKDG